MLDRFARCGPTRRYGMTDHDRDNSLLWESNASDTDFEQWDVDKHYWHARVASRRTPDVHS
jgi:hypothetical protein